MISISRSYSAYVFFFSGFVLLKRLYPTIHGAQGGRAGTWGSCPSHPTLQSGSVLKFCFAFKAPNTCRLERHPKPSTRTGPAAASVFQWAKKVPALGEFATRLSQAGLALGRSSPTVIAKAKLAARRQRTAAATEKRRSLGGKEEEGGFQPAPGPDWPRCSSPRGRKGESRWPSHYKAA